MRKLIPVITAGLIASAALLAGPSAPPVFQMRLALDTPSGDSEPMTLITKDRDNTFTNVLYIQKTVLLDQTSLKSAKPDKDGLGNPVISITLTEDGSKQFAEVTRQNIHKRLAIIINGKLREAPVIGSEIPGGVIQIAGSTLGKKEAQDLAREINGALGRK
jgi:preprotein translocase subunit SecD